MLSAVKKLTSDCGILTAYPAFWSALMDDWMVHGELWISRLLVSDFSCFNSHVCTCNLFCTWNVLFLFLDVLHLCVIHLIFNCWKKICKNSGPGAFFVGFVKTHFAKTAGELVWRSGVGTYVGYVQCFSYCCLRFPCLITFLSFPWIHVFVHSVEVNLVFCDSLQEFCEFACVVNSPI